MRRPRSHVVYTRPLSAAFALLLCWAVESRAEAEDTVTVTCPAGTTLSQGYCINTTETTYSYRAGKEKPVANNGCFGCQAAGTLDPGIGGALLLLALRRRRRRTS